MARRSSAGEIRAGRADLLMRRVPGFAHRSNVMLLSVAVWLGATDADARLFHHMAQRRP